MCECSLVPRPSRRPGNDASANAVLYTCTYMYMYMGTATNLLEVMTELYVVLQKMCWLLIVYTCTMYSMNASNMSVA